MGRSVPYCFIPVKTIREMVLSSLQTQDPLPVNRRSGGPLVAPSKAFLVSLTRFSWRYTLKRFFGMARTSLFGITHIRKMTQEETWFVGRNLIT
jgi:hypothetical protein